VALVPIEALTPAFTSMTHLGIFNRDATVFGYALTKLWGAIICYLHILGRALAVHRRDFPELG
jgi:hypothetical protein